MTTESPDALESLVGRIADEFTRRQHQGENPLVEEYTQLHPEVADLLREILPAIQALGAGQAFAETPRASDTAGHESGDRLPVELAEYEVLGAIGRGGMGVVYKARHRALRRIVALKMLRGDSAADLARFHGEAEAVARLQHPNIVQIFEVGEAYGQPFLVLEYVAGGSLAERVKGEPQPPRQAAALVRVLAGAMTVAHNSGLIHRDLKPSNILLALRDGEDQTENIALDVFVPKITDFGLAKRLDEDTGQTQTGAIVGTPGYMAPEQAAADDQIGPAADIHALGAILYELLTGRPPFKAASVLETLELVRNAEPTPPSRLGLRCPRDLETICLKCLHKAPGRRYSTATALADDLQRFLDGVPIVARPVGVPERFGKWLRRRPAFAASIGLGTLAAVAIVVLAVRLAYSWDLENANRKLGEAVEAKESALVTADEARSRLDAALERERALHYVHSITLAHREWQANRLEETRRILDACPSDLRHWEWHYLYRQCHIELLTLRGPTRPAPALAVSPGGGLIAAVAVIRSNTPVESKVTIWDAADGKVKRELVGLQDSITSLAFSPDGERLAYVSYALHAWAIHICDVQTGRELYAITGTDSFHRVTFSPDGTRLAAKSGSKIIVYDSVSGAELFTLTGNAGSVLAMAFSPDGRRLVSGGTDRLVKVWDLEGKKEVFSAQGHTIAIKDVAFSPTGDQIVSCAAVVGTNGRGEVRLWNAADGKPAPIAMTFPFSVAAAVFTANPGQIACAGGDGGVHFLDTQTGKTSFTLRGHTKEVTRLVVNQDGTRLVTASADLTIRVWPIRNPDFDRIPSDRSVVGTLAFSPDGLRLATSHFGPGGAGQGNTARVRVVPVPPHEQGSVEIRPKNAILPIRTLAFFPDNRRLAGVDQDGVHLLDLDNVAVSQFIPEFAVWEMSISPDGRHLATATRNPDVNPRPDLVPEVPLVNPKAAGLPPLPRPPVPAIKIWRVEDRSLVRTLPGQISVSYSPDGRRLAGAKDNTVAVWDAASGDELRTFTGPTEPVLKVQFAVAGRQVVGFTHHQAIVWDADTGRQLATVDGLNGPAFVTPDGRRIVGSNGGINGGIKWWDVQLGREVLFMASPQIGLSQFALSHDGRRLAVVGPDHLRVWEAGPP